MTPAAVAPQEKAHLVSVIMPSYNGERIIEDSIKSVLVQTHTPIELVIVDDASTDRTFERLEQYGQKAGGVAYKLMRHRENRGLAATLNHGLRESSGEYVMILHQDCVLADENWIAKALSHFSEHNKTAVVTGYYGLPPEKLTFVTKAFGIFRRQYHAKSAVHSEESVTFSEGKCDIYRREILESIEGFPERFRIAGEDLYVSYKIRQMGYSIVKDYRLPVIQKFGPSADSLLKNLRKEFVFGKAMGGIFPMFRAFLFKKVGASHYVRVRSLQRATHPLFVFVYVLLLFSAIIFQSTPILLLCFATLGIRYCFFIMTIWRDLRRMSSIFRKTRTVSFLEASVMAMVALIIDFVYTLGFCYGLALYVAGARL